VHTGAIATLQEELKQTILNAYVAIRRANQQLSNPLRAPDLDPSPTIRKTVKCITDAKPAIEAARDMLLRFLGSND
jgi:hypothetical protein